MIEWIKVMLGLKKLTLEEEAQEDAISLDRSILNEELAMIDMRYRIDANRAKQLHLQKWLQQRTSNIGRTFLESQRNG